MIELGGNIKLDGFELLEPSKLIVVKKIVGNYARKMSQDENFKSLTLTLKNTKSSFEINAKLEKDKIYEEKAADSNLFFAMDEALNKLISLKNFSEES